jgi:hypothetical protein
MMYELYFDSSKQFFHSLESDAGRKLLPALKEWGDARLITWFYSESWEEITDPQD